MARYKQQTNPDPITGKPGAHPLGTGIGAASGASFGAIIGSAAGPAGTATGAVIGAIAGGFAGGAAGSEIAEYVNPSEVDVYWSENFSTRPYAATAEYEQFRPAYHLGYDAASTAQGKFEDIEPALAARWESRRIDSDLEWEAARKAARDSYERTIGLYKERRAKGVPIAKREDE